MKVVLVQDLERPHHELRKEHIEQIQGVDPRLELKVFSTSEFDAIQNALEDAEILAGSVIYLPGPLNLASVKYIHSFSAGVERLLTPEVKSSRVLMANCSGIHAIPIAEHILGFLLIFTRRFYDTFADQQKKVWEKNERATELRGKTVVIVGLGHIGLEAARLVSCVGARVLAVDRPGREKPDYIEKLYTEEQIAEVLPEADFVVLCLPLTPETHHLFNRKKFEIMKDTAVVVNISRGPIVHEQELVQALQQQMVGGAALDVTEEEPLPEDSPLWGMSNVVITPHHSGLSEKYIDRAVEVFCENLQAYIKKEPLPNAVDKEKGY